MIDRRSKFFLHDLCAEEAMHLLTVRPVGGGIRQSRIVSVLRNNEFRFCGFFFEVGLSKLGFTMTARDD
jgi:hypothetical protein